MLNTNLMDSAHIIFQFEPSAKNQFCSNHVLVAAKLLEGSMCNMCATEINGFILNFYNAIELLLGGVICTLGLHAL